MKTKTVIVSVIIALTLASCGTELRLANRFIHDSKNVRAAVYFPEEAKVTLVQDQQGDYIKVLDSLDQNAFLDILYYSYAQALGSYGIEVYVPEDQDNVEVDSLHWLIVLSQMEIEGKTTMVSDQFFDLEDDFEFTTPLNTVNVAAWFDINDSIWHPTLFCEHNLMDDFQSDIYYSNGGYQYRYDVVPITTDDVYNYAVYLGQMYADYTYNHMMNRYIQSTMAQKNAVPRFKVRWNAQEKMFYLEGEGDGFIELESGL